MRALVLLAGLALACVSHPPPTPADRDAAITRDDFADWLEELALETKRESLSKAQKGGIVILEYAWLGDDGELAVGLHSRIYWTRTPAEAAAALRSMREGSGRGRDGIAWLPVHTGGSWAEDAKAYRLVRSDRQQVGHVLFARRENVAAMVMLTGMHSDDPKLFEKKLEPELWKLSRHDPVSGS